MSLNAQFNINAKENSKWEVKTNFVTSCLAFKDSILIDDLFTINLWT